MPGVIMENGTRNGVHANHERDNRPNGVNGANQQLERVQDKGKGRSEPQQNLTPTSPNQPNGLNGRFAETSRSRTDNGNGIPSDLQARINQLPPEIQHITEGYLPLSGLYSRLAQKTFNGMNSTIQDLNDMPLPPSTINGHGGPSSADDNSPENLNKKLRLIKFLQGAHADWSKGLAIADWSRKAGEISKLIDLRQHLHIQKQYYNTSIDTLCEYKRGLLGARLPNPNLKTALEVLTTGTASWMPDLGYIPPPALSAAEILKTIDKLNTLLSIRMNLHEHDNLPYHFQDYSISSGRVTFTVAGEFEVDLAIASEDPEIQFWFIDLRFTFSPKPADMDPTIRFHLEQKINEVLFREGLSGCYKYLHEIVLTRKVLEIRRQAAELARGRWVEGLKIEQLNRTLSIQYWVDRYSKGPKSWLLLGVHSGRPDHGRFDPKATSRLSIRWFRDGKEVKDEKITFDMVNLSAEDLLNGVIARHASHIMTSIYEKLQARPVFAKGRDSLELKTSSTDPAEACLKIQLTSSSIITVRVEPAAGRFTFRPASQRVAEFEHKLNLASQDPVSDAHTYLENLRYVSLQDEIQRHGISLGWMRIGNPNLSAEVLKPIVPKETAQMAWFRRASWAKNWYLAVTLGTSGQDWWLIQGDNSPKDRKVTSHIRIPLKVISPTPTYAFMSSLTVYTAALLSGFSNSQDLHGQRVLPVSRLTSKALKGIVVPSIYVRLSELLPSKNKSPRTGKPWAKDIARITFQGLELPSPAPQVEQNALSNPSAQTVQGSASESQIVAATQQILPAEESAVVVTEARMVVPLPKSITTINEMVDRDIAFDAKSGSVAFKIKSRVGESVISALKDRAVRVERLVDYVQVLQLHHDTLTCESISLGMVSFSYVAQPHTSATSSSANRDHATINFEDVEKIQLVLRAGDPLVRVSNLLRQILNDSKFGFDAVARYLPVTLPLLRAFDSIENSWNALSDLGQFFVLPRYIDSFNLRYDFFQQQPPGSALPLVRCTVKFEMKVKSRKGKAWWHIQRLDSSRHDMDDIDVALKPIWASSTDDCEGMRVSGVARPCGVERLLFKINEAIEKVAQSPVSPSQQITAATKVVSPPVQSTAPVPQRSQPTMQQRQQQQQQQNQRQHPNQNQNRNNQHKVIEID